MIFAGSIGRTDFPDGDHRQLILGIRAKLFTLPDDTILLPGHGPATTVGEEKRSNPFAGLGARSDAGRSAFSDQFSAICYQVVRGPLSLRTRYSVSSHSAPSTAYEVPRRDWLPITAEHARDEPPGRSGLIPRKQWIAQPGRTPSWA